MEQLLKHFRGRQKGTPNKLTSEIKDKLSSIISNPRDAIIQSYSRPIAHKDYILLDGVVIIKYCKLGV